MSAHSESRACGRVNYSGINAVRGLCLQEKIVPKFPNLKFFNASVFYLKVFFNLL